MSSKRFLEISPKTKKLVVIILVISVLLTLFMGFNQEKNEKVDFITRDKSEIKSYDLLITPEGGKTEEISVGIDPLVIPEKESFEILNKFAESLEEKIKGNNESLDKVKQNLILPVKDEETGIQLFWTSSDYSLCDDEGNISNSWIREGDEKGFILYCELSLSGNVIERRFDITVCGQMNMEENSADLIRMQIEEANENNPESADVILPKNIAGKSVSYALPSESGNAAVFIMLGIVSAGLLIWRDLKEDKINKEKRNEALVRDFPELTSKLYLLCNSGGTVFQSLKKIGGDYKLNERKLIKREAYEEVLMCIDRIERGIAEPEGYIQFGRRCNRSEYMRLAAFLSEHVRKGTGDLAEKIREISEESFNEYRMNFKEKASKAGTKLIFPMTLMLLSILLMICIPAMRGFSI